MTRLSLVLLHQTSIMNYQKFSLAFGFFVWLIATIVFRYYGHSFFYTENIAIMISLFVGIIPLLFLLVQWVFNKYKLVGEARLESAVLMALPGMFCDVVCLKFHAVVFPEFTIAQSIALAAWVLWAYALVIFKGLISKVRR